MLAMPHSPTTPKITAGVAKPGHDCAGHSRFKESGSTYLLSTTFTDTTENDDIAAGWWRPLNLTLPPFNLPDPLDYIEDADSDDVYEDKVLALWKIIDFP